MTRDQYRKLTLTEYKAMRDLRFTIDAACVILAITVPIAVWKIAEVVASYVFAP